MVHIFLIYIWKFVRKISWTFALCESNCAVLYLLCWEQSQTQLFMWIWHKYLNCDRIYHFVTCRKTKNCKLFSSVRWNKGTNDINLDGHKLQENNLLFPYLLILLCMWCHYRYCTHCCEQKHILQPLSIDRLTNDVFDLIIWKLCHLFLYECIVGFI